MIAASSAREEILSRIRNSLPGATLSNGSYRNIFRGYRHAGVRDRQAVLDLFVERLSDYDAQVVEINDESQIASAVGDILNKAGEHRLLTSAEFPATWLPNGVLVTADHQLSICEIDKSHAVLTTSEVSVAETGTIFLVHQGTQGRRVISLLPDHHICLVPRYRVYELLPQAFAALSSTRDLPITTISGPSATADIEMVRIRGVHGPRRLSVIIYGELCHCSRAGARG